MAGRSARPLRGLLAMLSLATQTRSRLFKGALALVALTTATRARAAAIDGGVDPRPDGDTPPDPVPPNTVAAEPSAPQPSPPSNVPFALPPVHVVADHAEVASARVVDATPLDRYRPDKVTLGPLGSQSAQDIPFSVSVVSKGIIEDSQATTTSEALRYVPTVYVSTGASEITPYLTLRGFSASTWTYNMALDGMRSFDIYQPMADKERIEVMAGATAALYGVTSPAGTVNYVLKRPTSTPWREASLGLHGEQLVGRIDVGGPAPGLPSLKYRLNADYGSAGEVGVPHQSQRRYLVTGVVDWDAVSWLTLSLEGSVSNRELKYAQPLFMTSAAVGIPNPPDTSENWGAPYTYATDTTWRVGGAAELRLGNLLRLRARARHTDITREYTLVRQVWQNPNLDYQWRLDQSLPFHTRVEQVNAFAETRLETGPVHHAVTIGTTADFFDAGDNGYHGTTFPTVYPGNLGTSPSYPPWADLPAGTSTADRTTYNTALLMEQASLLEQWFLLAGLTWARVNDRATSRTAAGVETVTGYNQNKATPTAALSWKPIAALTAYASYMESLQQGFTAASTTANAGQVFPPYLGRQVEAGAKSTLGGLFLGVAVFRISSANQYLDPTTKMVSQDGRAVHQGIEATANGRIADRLTLSGGFTWLRARIERAASNEGKIPQGVPERMGRLYAEYDIPYASGLAVSGAVSYTGRIPWDAANTLYVPTVTLFDAGLRFKRKLRNLETSIRLGVNNVAGTSYWTTRAGILYLGTPRVISLAWSVQF
jgi:iron complex outermembrane recepter protein